MTLKLWLKAVGGLVFLVGLLALLLFVPAGSASYWQGWVFLAIFTACTGAITLYLARRDPALLQRRVAAGPVAEQRPRQKAIQAVAQVAFLGVMLVPALDHRFGWSRIPLALVGLGDALVALGLYIVFRVFRANSYASATIEVGQEQRVIDSGPYALVRHPMYSGALLMLLGTPPALGSWWGLGAVVLLGLVIVVRLLDEEHALATELPGYTAYCERVRWRLVPGLF